MSGSMNDSKNFWENEMTEREETQSELLARLGSEGQFVGTYTDEVGRLSMEEKIVALAEETQTEDHLTPWDIDSIVLEALGKIGDAVELEHSELVYDVIYEAVIEALHRRD